MEIKETAASVILGILLISLVAIFLVTPLTGSFFTIALVVLILSLLLSLYTLVSPSDNWNTLGIAATLAGFVSTFAAYLVAGEFLGSFGALVIALLWGGLLFYSLLWIIRNTLRVPSDRAIVITNVLTGHDRLAKPPRLPPLLPVLERKIAEIPLYELYTDVPVEKVNTNGASSVDRINMRIHYKVIDPKNAIRGIPNRSQAQNDAAKGAGVNRSEAQNEVSFWEKLLNDQMKVEAEDILRRVVFNNYKNVVDVYTKRNELEALIRHDLEQHVGRWGVEIRILELDRVDVPPDRFGNKREKEDTDREAEARREALRTQLIMNALADTEAHRVKVLLQALKDSDVDLNQQPDLVMGVLRNSELILEGEFTPLTEKKDGK